MAKSTKVKIISAVVSVVLLSLLVWFMFSGDNRIIIQQLIHSDLTSDEMIELIRSFGIRGSITLSLLSMMEVVIPFLPEEPVQVLAGMGYGIWHGALICLSGIVLGNTIIYIACKIFGKSSVERVHQKSVEVDFEKMRSSKKIALLIMLLYILPAVPLGVICLFACSLNLKYPRYFLLTTLGSIPSILVGVALGHMATATSWIVSVMVFAIIVVLIVIFAINKNKFYKAFNNYVKKKQKTDEMVVKKPNPILYFLCKIGFTFFNKTKVKLKVTKKDKIKGPAIVLCTHGSFVDFLYCYMPLISEKPNIMHARLYSYRKDLAWLTKKLGAFPKSMFSTDIENAKNSMKVLSKGRILIMMPEARLSTVGEFEGIQDTTHKFLKKMNVPIYALKINGNYFALPKWGDKLRKKSPIEVSLEKLVSKEEIMAIDELSLREKVEKGLYYNEFEWIEKNPNVHYKHETLAEGLENILYVCPKCHKTLTINTYKKHLYCNECGFKATLNDRYGFVNKVPFNNFAEWYNFQKGVLKEQIENDPNYKLESKVELKLPSIDGKTFMRKAGFGTCTLNREGLTYKGTCDGEIIEKFFAMKNVYRLLFGAGEDFEIYENKKLWYFVPENKKSCVIWYNASEILKNLSLQDCVK